MMQEFRIWKGYQKIILFLFLGGHVNDERRDFFKNDVW